MFKKQSNNIATLLDEIASWTVGLIKNRMAFTIKSEIEYKRVIPTKQLVILVGEIFHERGNLLTINSYIQNFDGITYAKCQSIWKIPSIELMAKLSGVSENLLDSMVGNLVKAVKNYKEKQNISKYSL